MKFFAYLAILVGFLLASDTLASTDSTMTTVTCKGKAYSKCGKWGFFELKLTITAPDPSDPFYFCDVYREVRHSSGGFSGDLVNVYGTIDSKKIDITQWNWDNPMVRIYAEFNPANSTYKGRYENPTYSCWDTDITCKQAPPP